MKRTVAVSIGKERRKGLCRFECNASCFFFFFAASSPSNVASLPSNGAVAEGPNFVCYVFCTLFGDSDLTCRRKICRGNLILSSNVLAWVFCGIGKRAGSVFNAVRVSEQSRMGSRPGTTLVFYLFLRTSFGLQNPDVISVLVGMG